MNPLKNSSPDRPPEIISYYTMRRALGVLGLAFLPCPVETPAPCCLNPPDSPHPLIGSLQNIFALLYFLILIIYSMVIFPMTHMDMVSMEKKIMGRQKQKRNFVYYLCESLMSISLLLIILYMGFFKDRYPGISRLHPMLWLETIALASFGISRMTKGQLFFKDENYRKGP